MNLHISRTFRIFILGDPIHFQKFPTILEHLKNLIHTNSAFECLIVLISIILLISFVFLFISNITVNYRWVGVYFFGFCTLYCAFCIQMTADARKRIERIDDPEYSIQKNDSKLLSSKLFLLVGSKLVRENKNNDDLVVSGKKSSLKNLTDEKDLNNIGDEKKKVKNNVNNKKEKENQKRKKKKKGENTLNLNDQITSKKSIKKQKLYNNIEKIKESKLKQIKGIKSNNMKRFKLIEDENTVNKTSSVDHNTSNDHKNNDSKDLILNLTNRNNEQNMNKATNASDNKATSNGLNNKNTDDSDKNDQNSTEKHDDKQEYTDEKSIDIDLIEKIHNDNLVRKQKYIDKIHSLIQSKKENDDQFEKYYETLGILKDQTYEYYDKLENNFQDFITEGKKIKNELLAIDISLDPYIFEITQMKMELHKKFDILDSEAKILEPNTDDKDSTEKEGVTKDDEQQDKEAEKFTINSKLNSKFCLCDKRKKLTMKKDDEHFIRLTPINLNKIKEKKDCVIEENTLFTKYNKLIRNIVTHTHNKSNVKDEQESKDKKQGKNSIVTISENDEEIQSIIKNLKEMEYFMILQGALALSGLIIMIIGFPRIGFVIKILIIICIGISLYLGIVNMIYANILDRKCILQDADVCKKKSVIVAQDILQELQMNLDANKKQGEDKNTESEIIKTIQKRFGQLSRYYDKTSSKISKYIENFSSDLILEKIEVFHSMFNRLLFIKKDFNEIMQHKVSQNEYYKNIGDMKIMLQKIKEQVQKIDIAILLKIFKEFTKLSISFGEQEKEILDTVQSFSDDDAQENERKRTAICDNTVGKICKSRDEYDNLYIFMVLGGLTLSIISCL